MCTGAVAVGGCGSARVCGVVTAAPLLLAAVGGVAVGGGVAASPMEARAGGVTSRVSVSSDGEQANRGSFGPAISAGGRYVAFSSNASNLVAADGNEHRDVFVRDRVEQKTRPVSVGPGGRQANGPSGNPAISASGRYVAFTSSASYLVAGDTNDSRDVFVRDRVSRVTGRVSLGPGGSQGNDDSAAPAISADGRYVAFTSDASNLAAADTNRQRDVFVRDRGDQKTRRVSIAQGGRRINGESRNPAISATGRYIAFESEASHLVSGDTNGTIDAFVRDRVAHLTRKVSIGPRGRQANRDCLIAAISADGRFVTFFSRASNLVAADTNDDYDVFIRSRPGHVTRRMSVGPGGRQGNQGSYESAISANGRYVAFTSDASNLLVRPGDIRTDIFLRDRWAHKTRIISVTTAGHHDSGYNSDPVISARGRYVAFAADVDEDLVPTDTNDKPDVYLRDRRG